MERGSQERELSGYDVVIVGAGPAGLFAALELMKTHKVAILDAGKPLVRKSCPLMTEKFCTNCKPVCHIMGGFGGAQFFQGTKLARYPAGRAMLDFVNKVDELENLYDEIDKRLESYGKFSRPIPDPEKLAQLQSDCENLGLGFRYYNSQKVSRSEMNSIGNGIWEELHKGGVDFYEKSLVSQIEKINSHFLLTTKRKQFLSPIVILALGRVGARSMVGFADALGLEYEAISPEEIEIGIRIETPYHVFDQIDGVHNDLKVTKDLGEQGVLKTFCQEYRGFLTKCCYNLYKEDSFSTIDGYILGTHDVEPETRSEVSNLGIHHGFKPTGTLQESYEMVRRISAKKQPIFQSMKGFLKGVVDGGFSVEPSMPDAELEDINKFLPIYSAKVIKDFIYTLDKILPGISDGGNIVYAPSFELGAIKMKISSEFESNISGLYIGGDAAGHIRGSMQAMASGTLIGRHILRKKKGKNLVPNVNCFAQVLQF
ncbi:MAG: NAD(P)/FAD-dependent oxidoreductase [Deltaproteobacteria bacterium]|nr:NAD(P)/FAD-dependent oxidoreductase [Deltaproteobacteria bacterium]